MSNCFFYAVGRWWREGGYFVVRRSHFGWWPHFLWSPDLVTFYQYGPAVPNHHLRCPPPIFHGVVRQHGAPEQKPLRKAA